jgi:hypothetical protein
MDMKEEILVAEMRQGENRVVKTFEILGFECIISRGGPLLGNFNGYIGVPAGHPWHGKSIENLDCEVHGGPTWCEENLPWREGDGRWWIGFDTCHGGDLVVHHNGVTPLFRVLGDETFKGERYVEMELVALADQAYHDALAARGNP